ncbi:MAG: DUF1109 domain-containing protein [Xanthomonadales bacterium]|nr:DUF1109 domain-containing protein [Xanthomonadales bacterium]
MKDYKTLISELSSGLAPVSPPRNIDLVALAWFLLSTCFVVVVTLLIDPIRPGALMQLASKPRFLLETMLGVAAILWVSLAAFRSAVPGALTGRFATTGLFLIALWLIQYLIGLVSPALEPSTLGDRHHCWLEAMIYSLPVTVAGLLVVGRNYPLRPIRAGMFVGLVAGMLPALFMQLACMYEPSHIIMFHILPGLLMAAVSIGIAAWWHALSRSKGIAD